MITIKIKTDNDAFVVDRNGEIARILNEIADDYIHNGYPQSTYNDINGNKVCTVK